jgi:hypothetical protein
MRHWQLRPPRGRQSQFKKYQPSMKTLLLLTVMSIVTSTAALADGKVDFQPSDTPKTVLERQAGQRVELRLKSGEKLAGKVEKVGDKAVHLSAISGQEFFDAVVVLDDVTAVLVRTSK